MSALSYMAYVMVAGVLALAIAIPFLAGDHLWFVPLVVLPFCLLYLAVDRWIAGREQAH